jgi:hypothetical protein
MMRKRSGVGGSLGGTRVVTLAWRLVTMLAVLALAAGCAGGEVPGDTPGTGDGEDGSVVTPPYVGNGDGSVTPARDAGRDTGPATPDATPPDQAPSPTLTSIAPSQAVVGTTGPTLVVLGAGFVPRSIVQLNGAALTTSFVSSTELRATIPNASLVTVQTLHVSVGTAPPGGGASADLPFDVVNAAPSLTTLSPASVPVGAPDTLLTVTGAQFVAGATITFDGLVLATLVKSESLATATVPKAKLVTSGSFTVTIANPLPGGGTSSPIAFTVTNPTVTITSVTPDTVTVGAGATPVSLVGTGFVAASAVSINGAAAPTTFVDATHVKATLPASALTNAGNFPVVVTNPAPGGGVSTPVTFHVVYPLPTTTGLSPSSVVAGSAPPTVTVTGAGFLAGKSQVAFDGVVVATTVIDASHVSATLTTSQVATARSIAVTVVNPSPGGGTSTPPLAFTVQNPTPSPTALAPASTGVASPDTTVTVSGSGFVATSTVLAGGGALATSYVDAGTLTALIPAAQLTTARTFAITVSNPAPGGGVSAPLTFTVTNPGPTITAVAPASATVPAPATPITVAGSGFVAASAVAVNGTALATTYVNATTLTAVLPAAQLDSAGTLSITVVNPAPGGGASPAVFFAVNDPSPTLTAVSPTTIAFGAPSTTITLTGTGFLGVSVVKSNGATLTSTTQSATSITAVVPATQLAAAGTLTITVTNPPPGGGTSAGLPITITCNSTGVDYAIDTLNVNTTVTLSLASGTTARRITPSNPGAAAVTCPPIADTASEPFRAYVVQNTSGRAATLSAWAVCSSTTTRDDDAFLAFYNKSVVPTTQTEFQACSGYVSEGLAGAGGFNSPEAGGSGYCPGLTKANGGGFALPACGKAVVMIQAYSTTNSSYSIPPTLRMKLE